MGRNGQRQYGLHSVYVGGAWVSGRLEPGGTDVKGAWREQLEQDVAPLLVWAAGGPAAGSSTLLAPSGPTTPILPGTRLPTPPDVTPPTAAASVPSVARTGTSCCASARLASILTAEVV